MLPDALRALTLSWKSLAPPVVSPTPCTFSALRREDFSTSEGMLAAAKAGLLDTHVTIHCVRALLITQPIFDDSHRAGQQPILRNSFQWPGAINRHVQSTGLKQLKIQQAKQRLLFNRLNSRNQQLARQILRARAIYIGTLGPLHDTRHDEDLLWKEMLDHGDWATTTIQLI